MISYRAVLALPGTATLLGAALLARLAGRMFMIALVLYALGRFTDPAVAGWAGFAALAPGTIASPLAGALLDRLGAGRMILVDLAASALWLALLAIADAHGAMTPGLLLAFAALYALTTPLTSAGIRSILPRLVPPDARDSVNALDTTINGVVDTLGPMLAGPLYGFFGAPAAFGSIAARHALRRDIPGAGGGRLLGQAWRGIAHVFANPALRGLAVSYSLQTVSWGMMTVIVPVAIAAAIGSGAAADS